MAQLLKKLIFFLLVIVFLSHISDDYFLSNWVHSINRERCCPHAYTVRTGRQWKEQEGEGKGRNVDGCKVEIFSQEKSRCFLPPGREIDDQPGVPHIIQGGAPELCTLPPGKVFKRNFLANP